MDVIVDPRVARIVADYHRLADRTLLGVLSDDDLEQAARTSIANMEAHGLAVVLKADPQPDQWDIGDPPPPPTVISVQDDMGTDEDDDNYRWGRTTGNLDGWGDWKGYKNGGKVYLDWAELVRRWGPVRRG